MAHDDPARPSKPIQRRSRPQHDSGEPQQANSPISPPGTIEEELGVPIPGEILAPERWASTALKRLPENEPLDFQQLFGRAAPVALDIGCGNGRFVISSAVRRPDWDHVAIDILPLVIRYATRRANHRGLSNCRFAACDGARFLSDLCLPGSLAEIHIYHPQPYADSEKQHRRMLTPQFMLLVHRALRPGGKLFLQTDNPAYWEYFRQIVSATMRWHDQQGAWPEDPYGRSRREFLATEKGLTIYRGWAERRDELDDAALEALVATLPQPTFTVAEREDRRRPSHRHRQRRRKSGNRGRPQKPN